MIATEPYFVYLFAIGEFICDPHQSLASLRFFSTFHF